jgi:hypothetical protein
VHKSVTIDALIAATEDYCGEVHKIVTIDGLANNEPEGNEAPEDGHRLREINKVRS